VGAGVRYAGERWKLDLPLPSLIGAHQIVNAGTAIASLERLGGFLLTAEAIADGLRHIDWPARLQHLTRGALVDQLRGWEVWLDGGHNPLAGQVLAEVVAGWIDRPLFLVVGMINTKDAAGFLAPLAPHTEMLVAVTIPGEKNALPADAIAAAARSVGIAAHSASSICEAIRHLAGHRSGRVLICGSLYFAGRVLAENDEQEGTR
jgi:dihydrofolate synthase / folylpolyglutamate synthase